MHGADAMAALAVALGGHADSAHAARSVTQAAETAAQEGGAVAHRLVASMEDVRRAVVRLDQVGTLLEATLEPAAGVEQGLARHALLAVREARALAREALAASQGGSAWAAEAGACMAGLADAAREMDDLVLGIGSRSREHARDLAGASQAILRVDAMNQQGTRMVEEAALAARALQQQALDLSRAVTAFRLDETTPGTNEAMLPEAQDIRAGKGVHPYLRLASSRGVT
jgi:methyl-accepting chemotaxis protein